jgi:hypothetical protein
VIRLFFVGFSPFALRDVQVCAGINSVLAACAPEASARQQIRLFEQGNRRR